MLVWQILKDKGNNDVVSVQPGALVRDAAQILAERHIGTVVISTDGEAADGILSERDIVREIAVQGPECLAQTVDAIMTKELITCSLQDDAVDILATMTQGRFRHMPVMDDDKMVGLITLGDVVKARLSELSLEKEALEGMVMGR